MAFESIFDASNAKSFKFEKFGDVLEAYYMGSEDYEGDYNPTKKHVFKTATGAAVIIIGQRNLIQQLPSCKVGLMTRIEYVKDLPPTAKGRAPMKLFNIAQDRERTTEVPGLYLVTDTPVDDNGYYNPRTDDNADSDLDAVGTTEDVVPPRATAPRQPARVADSTAQAKAFAQMNRNKTNTKTA